MDAALRSGGRLHGGGRRRGPRPGSCGGLWRFSWEKHGIFMGKPWKNMEKIWKKHGKTMENTWQTWGFDGGFNGIYRKKPKHVCDGKPKKWKVEMGQVHDFFFR